MNKILSTLAALLLLGATAHAQQAQVPTFQGVGMTPRASVPFSVGKRGFWVKTADGLPYFRKSDGTDLSLSGGGGGSSTLATAYTTGASQTDSTLALDSTRLGVRIRDNGTPITGSLFAIQNSAGTTSFLDITAAGSLTLKSGQADGGASVAGIVDTTTAWSNINAKLFSVRTNAAEKFGIDVFGDIVIPAGSGLYNAAGSKGIAVDSTFSALVVGSTGLGPNTDAVTNGNATHRWSTTFTQNLDSGASNLLLKANANTRLTLTDTGSNTMTSGMADGASAVAAIVDTSTAWSNATAKIASFRNNGTEKAYFDKSGNLAMSANASVTAGSSSTNTTGLTITSNVADGATSTGIVLNNTTSISNASAGLVAFSNAGTVQSYIDTTGQLRLAAAHGVVNTANTKGMIVDYLGAAVVVYQGDLYPGSDLSAKNGSSTLRWTELWGRRHFAKGTALVAGDFALSGGWGTTASVGTISGDDSHATFTVTSSGTGQAANPTITLTFKDGTWTTAPFAQTKIIAGNAADITVAVTHTTTATTLVITFNGTPTAARTYTFTTMVLGT
jgi:hypothetical protein